jgi:hypothetical protein
MRNHSVPRLLGFVFIVGLLGASLARADELYGRIRGVVSDASGAVIAGATVTAKNADTGISKTVRSGADGSYEFVQLAAPGSYDVSAQQSGFRAFEARGIHLLVSQIYVLNIPLEVGVVTQKISVEAAPTQVESTSMQLGADLTSRDVTELPLIGRNWVQLQQTLPGTVGNSDRFGGDFASNGSRAQFNSYMVNGTDANDFPLNLVSFVPSPDAIADVHIVTNSMNPEYGRNSGAILNAVTKSGTNRIHGDGFEFFRDTSLNTRNFFGKTPIVFHQNLFGGTIGGPVDIPHLYNGKDRTFFFFSYQGIRNVQPENTFPSTQVTTVFTPDQRNGIFSSIAGATGADNCAAAAVPCLSPSTMVGEDGKTYPAGTPYGTLFPTGHIPAADLNPIAVNLMNKYVPLPNCGSECGDYSFNPTTSGKADQEIVRIDQNFGQKDAVWGYTFIQRNPTSNVLPFSGSLLPGFGSVDQRHSFSGTLAWNHTFGGSALNEARLGYNRFNFVANFPQTPVQPSSLGFNITPQVPADASVPFISVTGFFDMGGTHNGPQPRIDQTYQFTDNFSKIVGAHSFKMGFEMRRMQVYNPFLSSLSGNFSFGGTGRYSTGEPGADFLLGIPDTYAQNSGDTIDARAREYSAYFQDQFKVRPNLTLTYGVNWDDDTPITDIYHNGEAINCWIPGQQSKVFPTAPAGLDYPGDPGCTASGYRNHPWHFGPKLGLAWSPGSGGKTSIRGCFGFYFNRTEEEVTLQNLGEPPWGLNAQGIGAVGGHPSFADPWTDISTGKSIPNAFPFANPKPGANFDFSSLGLFYVTTTDPNFSVPYAMNFNLTVERQLPGNVLFSVGYVGSLARKLHGIYNLNFDVNPAGCLAGIGAEAGCAADRVFQKVDYPQNERYAGVTNTGVIGIGSESTFLSSNYNSLQVRLDKRTSHGIEFHAAYTWAHSLDYASSFEDDSFGGLAFDPTNFKSNYGNAGTDVRQRFTISYVWDLPKSGRADRNFVLKRLVNGWEMAGVTTFQTGFPVQIYESSYRELRCDAFDWTVCPDRPNFGNLQIAALQQPLALGVDPRSSSFVDRVRNPKNTKARDHYWFNPNSFALEPLGSVGNVGRNPFHGPGINNFNWSFYKNIPIVGESKYIQLRFEFYNLFNHTQFDAIAVQSLASNVVNGNAFSSNFGRITTALDPRLIQLAAKFYF